MQACMCVTFLSARFGCFDVRHSCSVYYPVRELSSQSIHSQYVPPVLVLATPIASQHCHYLVTTYGPIVVYSNSYCGFVALSQNGSICGAGFQSERPKQEDRNGAIQSWRLAAKSTVSWIFISKTKKMLVIAFIEECEAHTTLAICMLGCSVPAYVSGAYLMSCTFFWIRDALMCTHMHMADFDHWYTHCLSLSL